MSPVFPQHVLIAINRVWGEALGVPELDPATAHPHKFRSTFATRLLQAGVDLRTVSHLLGHSSVRITERYLGLLEDSELQAKIDRVWG